MNCFSKDRRGRLLGKILCLLLIALTAACGGSDDEVTPPTVTETPIRGHRLSKPYDFDGKKAVWFGNSITCGVYKDGNIYVTDWRKSYANLFSKAVGLESTNRAVSGSCFGSPDNSSLAYQTGNTAGHYDYVFVAGGTNDYSSQTTLGKLGDKDVSTYYGALDVTASNIKRNFPDARVIFITPINQCRNVYNRYVRKNVSLDTYRNAIYRVAERYGFDVVDGSAIPFPDESGGEEERALWLSDGVHPTIHGHKMYAEELVKILCSE